MAETMSSSHPLFSSIITLVFIILIFCPQLLPLIIFSPVIIVTAILLIFLLSLGATQRNITQSSCDGENNANQSEKGAALPEEEEEEELPAAQPDTTHVPDLGFEERFTEWNVREPLHVLYEEYEGEEEDSPSLSMYYLESDSDSSTVGGYTTTGGREEEEEEEREELIEICLVWNRRESESEAEEEEDNWIEINISPTRNGGDAEER